MSNLMIDKDSVQLILHKPNLDPASYKPFRITCSDGSVYRGKLDRKGMCTVSNLPFGAAMLVYGKEDDPERIKGESMSVRDEAKYNKFLEKFMEQLEKNRLRLRGED